MPPNQAMRNLYLTRQDRDVGLASFLVKPIRIVPPRSYVQLRCGEIAIVVASGERAHPPRVLCIFSQVGIHVRNPLPRGTQTDSTRATLCR